MSEKEKAEIVIKKLFPEVVAESVEHKQLLLLWCEARTEILDTVKAKLNAVFSTVSST